MGRCELRLITPIAEMSSVKRVLSSKVRIPRSQRITCVVAAGQQVVGGL